MGRDHVLRRLIANEIYRPLTLKEVACLVAPEVAARLDPDEHYGIQWFNRKTGLRTQGLGGSSA
jgi:hypothetical protein